MMMSGLKLSKAAGQRLRPALTTAHALNAVGHAPIAVALVPNANPLVAMALASRKRPIRHGQRGSVSLSPCGRGWHEVPGEGPAASAAERQRALLEKTTLAHASLCIPSPFRHFAAPSLSREGRGLSCFRFACEETFEDSPDDQDREHRRSGEQDCNDNRRPRIGEDKRQ